MNGKDRDEFERLWAENRHRLLREDTEYRQLTDSYKISSGADLLLFGIPAVAGVVFMDQAYIGHELLKWLACAAVVIATFVLCVWIKSAISGSKPVAEVEKRVKERCYKRYCEHGNIDMK